MNSNRRTEIEAAVAEYLARGGEISRPVATPHAAEILALRTQAARKAALAQVPAHLRDWVAELVHDAWSRRHDRRPQRARAQRDPARDP